LGKFPLCEKLPDSGFRHSTPRMLDLRLFRGAALKPAGNAGFGTAFDYQAVAKLESRDERR